MRGGKWIPAEPAVSGGVGLEGLGYIDADDVSTGVLNILPKTGQNRRSAGDFPPTYKIGKRLVCRVDEVDKWIRTRRVDRRS